MDKSPATAVQEPRFYRNLEVLRLLAALAVVLVHYPWFTNWGINAVSSEKSPALETVIYPIYNLGAWGVQFFWLLSGFIFFSQYGRKIQEQAVSGYRFALWRFSRLYPLHIVTGIAAFALHNIYRQTVAEGNGWFMDVEETWTDFIPHIFMASGLMGALPPNATMNFPIWSVSLELGAYASFFLAMRFIPRITLAVTPFALLFLPLVDTVEGNGFAQMLILFYAGGAAFLAVKWARQRFSANTLQISTLVSFALAGLIYAIYWTRSMSVMGDGVSIFTISMLCYAFVFTIIGAALTPQLSGKAGRAAEHMGNMTYSSYLIHIPLMIMIMIAGYVAGWSLPVSEPWFLITWLIALFTLSWLTYRWFEKPAQDWIRTRLSAKR